MVHKVISGVEDYFKDWVSDTFLGRLNPKSEGSFPGGDDNDNPVLFLAMGFMLLKLLGYDLSPWKADVVASIARLRVRPGYFRRYPNDGRPEAHDNYIGLIVLGLIFDLPIADEVCTTGERNGWLFDLWDPTIEDRKKVNLEYQRQGGDIAWYKLCAGRRPEPWNVLWMIGGLLTSVIRNHPSSINLGWLRFRGLSIAHNERDADFDALTLGLVMFGDVLFSVILVFRGGLVGSFKRYFRPDHPLISFAGAHYGTGPT